MSAKLTFINTSYEQPNTWHRTVLHALLYNLWNHNTCFYAIIWNRILCYLKQKWSPNWLIYRRWTNYKLPLFTHIFGAFYHAPGKAWACSDVGEVALKDTRKIDRYKPKTKRYSDVMWVSWRLRSLATRLFFQWLMQSFHTGNINGQHYCPFLGKLAVMDSPHKGSIMG